MQIFRRFLEISKSDNLFEASLEWCVIKDIMHADLILDTPLSNKIKKWNTRKFPNQIRCLCGNDGWLGKFSLNENFITNERCIVGECCAKIFPK